ncbi:lamin tail domain-containing protein [Flavivirga spongiicola]|uniref:Lamin tail domain-containing protein n=1 Tax=Flavivirga spongiicola TaxID=421621 RepID=A0ABU7XYR1_9FLAO|nr:lamin tail domain-containing protein [Flavivirga sp. MEBiC05379]MDO5980922.1 lamin tail domain-containing protein [Flavivirga sp. MEBiC05379]
MKSFFLFITLLLLVSVSNSQNFTVKLNAETGEVISGLPTSLAPEDKLEFQLYFDPSYKLREIKKLLDHHFKAYKRINQLIKSNDKSVLLLKDEKGLVIDYVFLDSNGYKLNGSPASYTRIIGKDGFNIHPKINSKLYSYDKQILNGVVISEILFDPLQSKNDTDGNGNVNESDQYIEFLNLGFDEIDIKDWKIFINGSEIYKFDNSTKIKYGEVKIKSKDFEFNKYERSLSGLEIWLEDNVGNKIDEVYFDFPIQEPKKKDKPLTWSYKDGKVIFESYGEPVKTSINNIIEDKFLRAFVPNSVVINEIFINPNTDLNRDGTVSAADRFIEITNYSYKEENMNGWKLYNGQNLLHTFSNVNIKPNTHKTIFGGNAPAGLINASVRSSQFNFNQGLFSVQNLKTIQTKIKEQVNCIMNDPLFDLIGQQKLIDWNSYDRQRDALEFPDKNSITSYTKNFNVPDYTTMFKRDYELKITYFDAKGQVINETFQKLNPKIDLRTLPKVSISNTNSNKLIASFPLISIENNGASEIAYELRMINPFGDYLNQLDDANVRSESSKFLSKKPLDNIFKKYSQINKSQKLSEYDKAMFEAALKHEVKLYDLSVQSNTNFNKWFLDLLWFNKGALKVNPFNNALLSQEYKSLDADIKLLESRIANSKDIHKLASRANEKSYFYKDPVELNGKKKAFARVKGKIEAINSLKSRGQLLYKGRLFLSQEKKNITDLMRHHDAKNKYISWYEADTKEVSENQELHVLVENEKVSTVLNLSLTETAIDNEETITGGDANKDGAPIDGGSQVVKMDLSEISKKKTFYIADFAYEIPTSSIEDTSPSLQTIIVPYQPPVLAPSNVSYTIKSGPSGKEKEEVNAKFRNNKLYRLRLKAGLLYSGLKLQSIDTTGTADVGRKNDFGVDGTFGLQIYFKRTDIRKIGTKFRGKRSVAPFIYLGFSMKSITENLYVGAGLEPFSGVSLMGGLHIGERDKIGQPDKINDAVIGKEWATGIFGSIVIDTDVITKLFGLSTAIPIE